MKTYHAHPRETLLGEERKRMAVEEKTQARADKTRNNSYAASSSHPHFLKARELVLVVACSVSGLIVNVILEIALYEAVKTDEGPAKDQEDEENGHKVWNN